MQRRSFEMRANDGFQCSMRDRERCGIPRNSLQLPTAGFEMRRDVRSLINRALSRAAR